ncbi:MAG: hypothetical protein AB9873_17785 [Syntrophobacteraceae bacterium]
MEKCPVCGGFLKMENQIIETRRRPNFFSGLGNCFNCGRMRVSGKLEHDILTILTFIPVCDCCDSDVPVIKLTPLDPEEMRWVCQACGMLLEVEHRRMVRTPSPCELRPALAIV